MLNLLKHSSNDIVRAQEDHFLFKLLVAKKFKVGHDCGRGKSSLICRYSHCQLKDWDG